MNKIIKENWFFVIPIIWLTLWVLYARTLEAFTGIGIIILAVISTIALFAGTISYRINNKILYSIITVVITFTVVFFLLILYTRYFS